MHLTSCRTLVILITSIGEFLLYYSRFFYLFHFTVKEKKKKLLHDRFSCVVLCCPIFAVGIHFPLSLNCDQMEHLEGEQYSQYPVERNPRAYMSMRDYRNPPWVSAPSYMVPPQYAPPPHPQYASSSQPQPPQPISPIEQAILDLTKLVGDFVEEQKAFNAKISQRIHTVENSLDQKLDGLQSGIDHKIDNLQTSISRLAQQHVHQEEENLEEECILGEPAQMQPQGELMQEPLEALEKLPAREEGGGRGKGVGEEHQRLTLYPIPINLDPSATAQPKNNPLPVNILPTPAPHATPKAPTIKATPSLPAL